MPEYTDISLPESPDYRALVRNSLRRLVKLKHSVRSTVKAAVRSLGFDIIRSYNSPRTTMLGLKALPISLVIDVGANEGQFATMVLKMFPEAKVLCFEPVPDTFRKLESWAERFKDRVDVFNIGLGLEDGTVNMFAHTEHSASSSFLATTNLNRENFPFTRRQETVEVKVKKLDTVVSTELLQQTAGKKLLKLDVQGYEEQVLRGAPNVLKNVDACLLEIIIDRLYDGQSSFASLLSLLNESGFRYAGNYDQAYGQDGHVMWLDALFLKAQ